MTWTRFAPQRSRNWRVLRGHIQPGARIMPFREERLERSGASCAKMSAFFWWTAWAAATDRPGGTDVSYTQNWPHEPLVRNQPTAGPSCGA